MVFCLYVNRSNPGLFCRLSEFLRGRLTYSNSIAPANQRRRRPADCLGPFEWRMDGHFIDGCAQETRRVALPREYAEARVSKARMRERKRQSRAAPFASAWVQTLLANNRQDA